MTVVKPRVSMGGEPATVGYHGSFAGADRIAARRRSQVKSSVERTWARHYRVRLRITDIAIILAVVCAAMFVRFGFDDATASVGKAGVYSTNYWTISVVVVLAWMLALAVYRTRDSRVIGMGAIEYKRVINSSALTFGILAIVFLVGKVEIARGYFIIAFPLGTLALLMSRWLWRKWLIRQRRFDHYLSRALVVGGRDDVEYVITQIQQKSGAAYNVVGAAVEGADAGNDQIECTPRQVPVVAGLADVMEAAGAASRLGVDTVIVAGQPTGGSQFIRNLGWHLEGTATDLVLASRLTDVAGPRIHFRPVEGLPLIHVEIPQFEGGKHYLKRALDIIGAGAAMIIALPLFAVVGIAILFDDHGPVFFSQERVGRNGATFRMHKFRSMKPDAEKLLTDLRAQNDGNGVLFKMKHDPRVTRAGRVLRKYSLDEVPQLWNVFVGEMSLVGPRPPLPSEVEGYEDHVHRRLYIKPGLTGMWQINGRSDLSWEDSVRLDLYYVENWSLTGDLMIMWRTVKVLLHPVGAY
jgi:exopolysaccharide biosynthesis polyprenyl glycosylphosphotransferase